jgi:hypothetical protein
VHRLYTRPSVSCQIFLSHIPPGPETCRVSKMGRALSLVRTFHDEDRSERTRITEQIVVARMAWRLQDSDGDET